MATKKKTAKKAAPKKKASKKKAHTVNRSAETGEFVTDEFAKKHKDTTVKEKIQ